MKYNQEERPYWWWWKRGFVVRRGQRHLSKNSNGRAVFNRGQVVERRLNVVESSPSPKTRVSHKPDDSHSCDSYEYEGSWEETLGSDFY
jgi:hypothetical protein